jgi:hypothetical protein
MTCTDCGGQMETYRNCPYCPDCLAFVPTGLAPTPAAENGCDRRGRIPAGSRRPTRQRRRKDRTAGKGQPGRQPM